MEVKNDMLYSAVQLWQLVTGIQHFRKNFVITGMSLSLTPSPVHVFHRSSSIYFNKKIDMRTARLVQTLHDLLLEAPFCKNAQNILLLFWSCHLLTHKITFFFFFSTWLQHQAALRCGKDCTGPCSASFKGHKRREHPAVCMFGSGGTELHVPLSLFYCLLWQLFQNCLKKLEHLWVLFFAW